MFMKTLPSSVLVVALCLMAESYSGEIRNFAFNLVFEGSVFDESKLHTTTTSSLLTCANYCCLDENCNGVNFQTTLNGSSLYQCELMKVFNVPPNVSSVSRPGWSSYIMQVTSPLKVYRNTSASRSETNSVTTITAADSGTTTETPTVTDTNSNVVSSEATYTTSTNAISSTTTYTSSSTASMSTRNPTDTTTTTSIISSTTPMNTTSATAISSTTTPTDTTTDSTSTISPISSIDTTTTSTTAISSTTTAIDTTKSSTTAVSSTKTAIDTTTTSTSTISLTTTTTRTGWVDTNPEYCSMDGAFVINTKIYLISGQAIYTYNSVDEFPSGPTKSQWIGSVLLEITAVIDAIFTDGTNLYVCQDGMVRTFIDSSGTFEWSLQNSVSEAVFFGETFGDVRAAFLRNSETIVVNGADVTGLATSRTCQISSSCGGNALLATNAGDAPEPVNAGCAISDELQLLFNGNNCYKYFRANGDKRGTWSVEGAVKCR